jgi:hypothetical protein
MNSQILSEWLVGLSLQQRARTLNRIAHNLTVCTREFEAPLEPFKSPAIVIKKLIGLSELQHQLSAQIGHYMDGEEIKVYPVDVFAQILFEKAAHYDVVPFLKGAISYVKTGSWGDRHSWSVEEARAALHHYQTKHKANLGFDYVAAFDVIFRR